MRYGGDGRTSKSIWAHEPILTPERKVWRAVLEQAYLDSELTVFSDASESMEKSRAQRFLRADGASEEKDLHRVCEFADVPQDRVFLWARRRYPAEQTLDTSVESVNPAGPEPSQSASDFSTSLTAELQSGEQAPIFSTPIAAEP
jgi:hypothetical protein